METENKFKTYINDIKSYFKTRFDVTKRTAIAIRVGMIIFALVVSILISALIIRDNPLTVIGYMFDGAFSRPTKLFYDAAILLGFGIAILPCFRMKYWNMGANGQLVVASVVCIVLMKNMGPWAAQGGFNNFVLIALMFICAVLASVIWAVIPAIFKAYFNTNETLFTLMMNYVAIGILNYVNIILSNGNSSTGEINFYTQAGWLTGTNTWLGYVVTIAIILTIAILISGYISLTKEGYEIVLLGDSIKTAQYAAMDTKAIIIRTCTLSGIITGIMGFLIVSAINHSATNEFATVSFNGILVSWLAAFDPLAMTSISVLFSFLTNGMSKVTSAGGLGSNDLVNLIFGLVFFSILLAEFFVKYKIDYQKLQVKYEKWLKKKEDRKRRRNRAKAGDNE